MSMFSEIATEDAVRVFVAEVRRGLEANRDKPEVQAALKKVGRFALTQFEWSIPDWAKEYRELFKESR